MSNHKIDPEHYFVLCNGAVLKNIKELAVILDDLTEEEFTYHVNEEKNDFSNWMRGTLKAENAAEKIAEIKDKKDMQIALFKHMIK